MYTSTNEVLHRGQLTTFVKLLRSLNLYERQSCQDYEAKRSKQTQETLRRGSMMHESDLMHFNFSLDYSIPAALTGKKRKSGESAHSQGLPRHLCERRIAMEKAVAEDEGRENILAEDEGRGNIVIQETVEDESRRNTDSGRDKSSTKQSSMQNKDSQGRVNCLFLMCVFLQHGWRVGKECAWQH